MGIFDNFPYSNFHELNLDWVLREVKRVIAEAAQASKDVATVREYVESYFANLDVSDEINAKLEAMAESGELENIIAAYLDVATTIVVDTVEDMVANKGLRAGGTCMTKGFYEINDGGGAMYYITEYVNTSVAVNGANVIALSNPNIVAVLLSDVANVKQYGAKTDDEEFDNGPIFSIACASSKEVYVPCGSYFIDSEVVIPKDSTRRINGEEFGTGGTFIYMGINSRFNVVASEVSINGLRFTGRVLEHNNGHKCIVGNPWDGLNCDIYIKDCVFNYFEYPITVNGRGLQVENCYFNMCGDCLTYNYIGTSEDGNPVTNIITGGRALRVTNSRFHANSVTRACIRIKAGSVAFQLLVDGCQYDAGVGNFFVAEGDVYGGIISNNILCRCSAPPFVISSEICNGLKICDNNVFNFDSGDGFAFPSQLFRFDGGELVNCDFSGNTCRGSKSYCWVFVSDSMKNCRVDGNIFDNVCIESKLGPIYVTSGAQKCSFSNNILTDTVSGVANLISGTATKPVGKCVILGNVKPDDTNIAIDAQVPSANNVIQNY